MEQFADRPHHAVYSLALLLEMVEYNTECYLNVLGLSNCLQDSFVSVSFRCADSFRKRLELCLALLEVAAGTERRSKAHHRDGKT